MEMTPGMDLQRSSGSGALTVIEPRRAGLLMRVLELWRHKHLLRFFMGRSVRARYKETVLGWLWLLIRPLIPALVYATVFGQLAEFPSDGLPYIVFLFPGLGLWSLFTTSLIFITRSLRGNRQLITRLYFPRMIVPAASIAPALIEFLVHLTVFGGILVYYLLKPGGQFHLRLDAGLLAAGFFVLLTIVFVIGIGLWTSVLNAQARDVRMTLPYILQMWFYLTPVIYPLSFLPEGWRGIAALNPMAILVEGFRWSLLGTGDLSWADMVPALGIIGLTFLSGIWFFGKFEARFVDSL